MGVIAKTVSAEWPLTRACYVDKARNQAESVTVE